MSQPQYIAGKWVQGAGEVFGSLEAGSGELVAEYRAATATEVDSAVTAARAALPAWSSRAFAERAALLEAYAAAIKDDQEEFARLLGRETGKPLWEARTEIAAMAGKIALSLRAYDERNPTRDEASGDLRARLRWRPMGVAAVFGPFNMPGHLPNGHIVPALLAGNTIVFKPSELTPAVGERMVRLWEKIGLPPGVLNLVQGGLATGQALAAHAGLDALFFTGSSRTGLALAKSSLEFPGRMLALEMGGNNPLVIWDVADVRAAAYQTLLSAYITAGQRCTCARRLILPEGRPGDLLLEALEAFLARTRIGLFDEQPEPFLGPVIAPRAGEAALQAQDELAGAGGRVLRAMASQRGLVNLLSPGLMDVTGVDAPDEEIFAPFLQVVRVKDFDAALAEANRTAYGLAAGLLSDSASLWETFIGRVRAGVINRNRFTTGASGALPFGGVGKSGNFRPGGFFAADYCAYPVASLEREELEALDQALPGIEL